MSVFQAIVLGMVQGVTEFLPVSSSGHLIFFPKLFGWADQGLVFDTVIHLGTLLAVLFYFRKKLIALRGNRRLLVFIFASAIPAAGIGALFGDKIESAFRSPEIVAWNLIGWGLVLGYADWHGKKSESMQSVGWKHTVSMAAAQVLALVPGTSRSGITMTAGLFSGLPRSTAAEFSFLMSIPIIALAGGKGLLDFLSASSHAVAAAPLFAGFLSAAFFGFIAIAGLMRFLVKHGFLPFVVYRIIVGVLILTLLV